MVPSPKRTGVSPSRQYAHACWQPRYGFTLQSKERSGLEFFVSKLFAWVRKHPRCKMLVYYQDFGEASSYRIQNYPSSVNVLRARLHSGLFPAFAPGAPRLPPPPPGGVGAR